MAVGISFVLESGLQIIWKLVLDCQLHTNSKLKESIPGFMFAHADTTS